MGWVWIDLLFGPDVNWGQDFEMPSSKPKLMLVFVVLSMLHNH